MGCASNKDKEQKAEREAHVRAALGAGKKPEALKDRHEGREKLKAERAAERARSNEEESSFLSMGSDPKPKKKEDKPKPRSNDWMRGGGGKKTVQESSSDEAEEEEDHESKRRSRSRRGSADAGKTAQKKKGESSSSAVRGGLLEQLAGEREKARTQTEEMDYLRGELVAMRELREQDQQDKKKGRKHDKTEVEAYQEMVEQSNTKHDKLEQEIVQMKRTLQEVFSPAILEEIFPKDLAAAAAERKQRATDLKKQEAAAAASGIFGVFGGVKKPKMAKGMDQLLSMMNEQTRELRELKRERDKLQRMVAQYELREDERNATGVSPGGAVLGVFGAKETAQDWEDKLNAKSRECDDLSQQLRKAQDVTNSLRNNRDSTTPDRSSEAAADGSQLAVCETGDEPQTPAGGNKWFSGLFSGGGDSEALEEEALALTQGSGAGAAARRAHIENQLSEVQLQLSQSEHSTKQQLEDLVKGTSSKLLAQQETCDMLQEQRAGALEQLSQLRMDYERLRAERAAEGCTEPSDAEQQESYRQRVEALTEQVSEVVQANEDLMAQSAEILNENSSLTFELEERNRECITLKEALTDATESLSANQDAQDALRTQVEEVLEKDLTRSRLESLIPGANEDLAHSVQSLESCVAVLQSSKAVSDCEARTSGMWRSRCVELEGQRDAALEVALCLTKAVDAAEATSIVESYLSA